ncbi:MAG: PAS domain S-box protein [Thermodesulfobacteriota bacterium]
MLGKIKNSLKLKWMIFSILLATVPLAIAGFNIIQIYQKDLKKSIFETEEVKANIVVEKIEAFFEKVTSNLLFLVRDENFRKSGFSHTKGYLENLLYQNDYLVGLTLLNEKGQETVKVSKYKVIGPSDLKDQSKSHMFMVASEGKIFYGNLHLTPEGFHIMVIAVPIEKYRGRIIGVLSAKINLQHLLNLISRTWIGEKRLVCVMDREGYLIADHHLDPLLFSPFLDRVIAGKEGSLEYKHPQGEEVLVIYKPLKELMRWSVIVQVPLEEIYRPVREMIRSGIIWILITLCIAITISLILTRKLISPIKSLSKGMIKVAKGNLDVHIHSTAQDEIGILTESFNQMVRDLKESQKTIKEAEEKYRRIFENSKDTVYITSVDGKWIDVNQAGVEMFGYSSKEELMQIHVKDTYLNPEECKRFQNEIAKEGFIKDFEVKLKKKDGTPIDVLITASMRRDEEGDIIGYEGNIKDISLRKRVMGELLQRTEELQTLYDLGWVISQTLDLDKVLAIALDRASNLVGFEMGSIYLYNENEETLELRSYKGYTPAFVEKVRFLKFGEGVSGKVIELKQPISISIDEYSSHRILPFLKEEGIQSLMGFPLLMKGRAIGAVTLVSRSVHHLTQREINFMESIGNQIGLTLENAKLFSDAAKAKSDWETTFDAVTDLITVRDKDYRILRANKAAFKRYGLKPEEMIEKRCFETLHHSDQPCEGCYVSETLRTKKPISGERESKYLNGIFRYFTFPVYNEVGEVTAVVDLAREITEEKRLEIEKEVINNIDKILASSLDVRQVIKAVHSELKKVFDSERMTITLLDEGGEGFQYFALEKDYEAKELVGGVIYPKEGTPFGQAVATGLPVIVSDTAESDSWMNQKLLKEGIRSSLILPLEYKGKIIGTLNFGSKEPNSFSERLFNLLNSLATSLAISIQNSLLLDSIKGSEERYRTVVEGALEGVVVVYDDYWYKYVNEKFAEIVGYPRDELIGMDYRNLLDEESNALIADRIAQARRGEELSPIFEVKVIRKDREVRNVEIRARAIKDLKGERNIIAFINDITEKKRMEEQLLQNEKLRALGEMASGVAHDFNNALAAILGNTQVLLYTAKDEETKESLRIIEKVARDSAQTVRRLQDFTRRRVHRELFRLDVNSVVKDAIEITKPRWRDEAQGRGVSIEMVTNFEEIPPVSGNVSEMREAITNMIFNAIEAMPEGGKIEIQTFERKEKVYIRISDTGIGMSEEVMKKIFEPFFTTKPFSNTGLGLSMSYGIIKRFGGEIEVESKLGKGTTFTIVLPIELEGKEESIPPSLIRRERGARILVIDDEETVRSVLSKILFQNNHQVTVAEDGEEGIRLFREKEFDMVLTDLGMPGMSGWEVCRTIKQISPHTPVGMITGWGMELSQAELKENKLDFLISKPFDFNQILNAIAEAMESREKRLLS